MQAQFEVATKAIAQLKSQSTRAFHTQHATFRTATFAQMGRSTLNVRRKVGEGIAELAALIRAQGLLQNLIGYVDGRSGPADEEFVQVVAGGRRLEAIGMLIKSGCLPEDFAIPYLLVPVEDAVAISLAENSGREPMHPADLFEAMRELASRGASVDDIAAAFGISALAVKRRLKLANVAPRFVAMYRDDQVSFDELVALSICDDHGTQEHAWDSLDKWSRNAFQLRRLLTAQQVDVRSDRVARYVGVEAFEKAGGVIVRDLFSESNAGFIDDAALLERLAQEKMQQSVQELEAEGWAWLEVRTRMDPGDMAQYGHVRATRRQLSEDEVALARDLEEESESLDAELDLGSDEVATRTSQSRKDDIEKQLQTLYASVESPNDAERALAGALVTISPSGTLIIHRNLIRPSDKSKLKKSRTCADANPVIDGHPMQPQHSARLTRTLTAQRTVALHAELMMRPHVALAVLAQEMIARVFYTCEPRLRISRVNMEIPVLPAEALYGDAPIAVRKRHDELFERLPGDIHGEGLLAWLLGQDENLVLEYISYCTACAIDTVQDSERPSPAFSALARAVSLDMRKWWAPTAETYFKHIPKAQLIVAVETAISPEVAAPLTHLKKDAAGLAAENIFAGSGWLPTCLIA